MVGAVTDLPGLGGGDQVIEVLERLQAELLSGAEWENDDLGRFLEGFGALLGSIENAYINAGSPAPDDPWVLVAAALLGARFYE
jgi:hypothetical protein